MSEMEARLLGQGPGFVRRLNAQDVDKKLQGPSRVSEGLVKHDHETSFPILHFSPGKYEDAFDTPYTIKICESRFPGENAKLKCQMDLLARREKVEALRTIKDGGGAALLFAVVISKKVDRPGWTGTLTKLTATKRHSTATKRQLTATKRQSTATENQQSKRFKAFFSR